jgi:hypothetical protein
MMTRIRISKDMAIVAKTKTTANGLRMMLHNASKLYQLYTIKLK